MPLLTGGADENTIRSGAAIGKLEFKQVASCLLGLPFGCLGLEWLCHRWQRRATPALYRRLMVESFPSSPGGRISRR